VEAGLLGADRDHLVAEVTSPDDAPATFALSTITHALSWQATGFQPTGLADGLVVGMTVAGGLSDFGTPEALNAQTGAAAWSASGLNVNTAALPGGPAVITPDIVSFEANGVMDDQTYLVSTQSGKVLKTLPGSYACKYDQVSVVACYYSAATTANLIAFDVTSLNELWELPDPAGTRIAPQLHAAYKGLLYTEADNGDVILNARTGTDLVANVPIAPDLVVPGYGLVNNESNGDNTLLAYPATA
jgi:outer membrane protein assembly factor BamB